MKYKIFMTIGYGVAVLAVAAAILLFVTFFVAIPFIGVFCVGQRLWGWTYPPTTVQGMSLWYSVAVIHVAALSQMLSIWKRKSEARKTVEENKKRVKESRIRAEAFWRNTRRGIGIEDFPDA